MAEQTIDTIFRDYVTDGVPLSGSHKPVKSDIRAWLKKRLNADRSAVSSNTSITDGFDGRTVSVTAAAVTLTFAAASTLDDDFVCWLINPQTDAAVRVVATSSEFQSFWLWPGQTATVYRGHNGSSAVLRVDRPNRYRPNGGETFFVNPSTGSDSNDGLASGRAFATVQKAINTIEYYVDHDGAGSTIKLASGAYTETSITHTFRIVGYHVIYIEGGDTANPSATTFTIGSGGVIFTARDYSALIIRAVTLVSSGTGAKGLSASQFGIIDVWDIQTDTFASGFPFEATNKGSMGFVIGSLLNRMMGNSSYWVFAGANGNFICTGCTITVDGSLTVSIFALATGCSVMTWSGVTFAGAGAGAGLTGQKYNAQYNAFINTGALTLPGATAGGTFAGGQVQ